MAFISSRLASLNFFRIQTKLVYGMGVIARNSEYLTITTTSTTTMH
jgi:hypothetical protein